jgi:hypothetical protein
MTARDHPHVELFPEAAGDTRPSDGLADVEVVASVEADELQAKERPQTRLSVIGEGARRSDESRRENLPVRVEPGMVYRDVRVYRRVDGRLPEGAGD